MNRMKAGISHIGLVLCLLAVFSFAVWGCSGKDKKQEAGGMTKVNMKVANEDGTLPNRKIMNESDGKIAPAIDPNAHPNVVAIVYVSAPDINPPLEFFFTADEIRAGGGRVTMLIPSGQQRTFTPTAFEFYQTPAANTFPGVRYMPDSSTGARTVDLVGEPVDLTINMIPEPVATLGGVISDDRTGPLAPIDPACAKPDVTFTFYVSLFKGQTLGMPVDIGTGGTYSIVNMPIATAMHIDAGDSTTGAANSLDLEIPGSVTSATQNVDLTGAARLAISPVSPTVLINGAISFSAAGGIPPYSFSISDPADLINPASSTSAVFTAGLPGGGRLDTTTVTDNCLVTASTNVTINWRPLLITPSSLNIAPYDTYTFTASGGCPEGGPTYGIYSWGFSSHPCPDSNISPGTLSMDGHYSAGANSNCTDVIQLSESGGASCNSTPATATVNVGPALQIAPTSVSMFVTQQTTFTASGGKPPYNFIIFSDTTGGASVSPTTGLYVAGPVAGISFVRVGDSLGFATSDAIAHVWYPPLSISPLNPTISSGENQMFTASGGNGVFNWAIIVHNCSASSIDASGLYSSSVSTNCIDTIQLSDTGGTTPVTTNITVGSPAFSVQVINPSTSSFLSDDQIGLQVEVSNIPVLGDDIRLEVIQDANGNGVADAGEIGVKIFELYDGQSMGVYSQVPWDEDTIMDRHITTTIPYYSPPHFAGNYILRATDLTNAATDETTFSIAKVTTKPRLIQGQVRYGATPQPGALVIVNAHNGRTNWPQEWAWTDSGGNYQIYTNITSGKADVMAVKPGYLSIHEPYAPTVDLSMTGPFNVNLSLTATTITYSGTIEDQVTGNPIQGVLVGAETVYPRRYMTMAWTDTSGIFTLSLIPGYSTWDTWGWDLGFTEHGYVGLGGHGYQLCNVSTSQSGAVLQFQPATAVITGTVSPTPASPVDIEAGNAGTSGFWSITKSIGTSYELPIISGGMIDLDIVRDYLGNLHDLANTPEVDTSGPGPYTANFTLTPGTYSISGYLRDQTSAPVEGVEVHADLQPNGSVEIQVSTDATGLYQLWVNNGDWRVNVQNDELNWRNDAVVGGKDVTVSGANVGNVNFDTANSAGNSKISGTVLDDSGGSISAGANPEVLIFEWNISGGYGEITNMGAECGYYEIRAKPTATYYALVGRAEGYMEEYWQEKTDEASADHINPTPPTPLPNHNFTLGAYKPYWIIPPFDLTVPTGALVNNLIDGTADDANMPNLNPGDPGYMECTWANNTCSFAVNIYTYGTGVQSCDVNFSAPSTVELCSVDIVVTDGTGASISQTININVTTGNTPPYWSPPPSNITISGGQFYNYTNGGALDFDFPNTGPTAPGHLTCSSLGTTCSFTPLVSGGGPGVVSCAIQFTAPSTVESCTLDMAVMDGMGLSKSQTININVTKPTYPPFWITKPVNINVPPSYTFSAPNGSAGDSDLPNSAPGDPGYEACSSATNTCSFTVNVTGSGSGTVGCNVDFTSPATTEICDVLVVVTDGMGMSISQPVTINVTPANSAPFWVKPPVGLTIATGQTYNNVNGVAGDLDWPNSTPGTNGYLTCSAVCLSACPLTLSTSSAGPGTPPLDCVISITSPASGTWPLHIAASDGGTPALSVSQNVMITANKVWFVDAAAAGANNGASWADGFTKIQSANSVAVSGDMVWVANGHYEAVNSAGDGQVLNMKSGVGVFGGFNASESALEERPKPPSFNTILDGLKKQCHVVVGNNNVLLDGFKITGGNAISGLSCGATPPFRGGGIFNPGTGWTGSTFSNLYLVGNYAYDDGGGMYNNGTVLQISNSVFFNNTGRKRGGGISNRSGSNITISNSVISLNISDNTSYGNGGGIYNFYSSPSIINDTFLGNYAYYAGGAIFNNNSNPTVLNSILWNDSVYLSSSNTSTGPYCSPIPSPTYHQAEIQGNATVTYSDVGQEYFYYYTGSGPSYNCYYGFRTQTYPGAGNIYNDPLFVDVISRNIHIQAGSPCIDAGNPSPSYNDPNGSRNDMGAFGGPGTLHFDSDYDGMDDWWEMLYYPTLDPLIPDANGNPDGDGCTNIQEFYLGKNPTIADCP